MLTSLEQKAQKVPGFRHAALNSDSNALLKRLSRRTTSHLELDGNIVAADQHCRLKLAKRRTQDIHSKENKVISDSRR